MILCVVQMIFCLISLLSLISDVAAQDDCQYRSVCQYGWSNSAQRCCSAPERWPTFATLAELQSDPWGAYYKEVYGEVPTSGYPIRTVDLWMIHEAVLVKAKVSGIPDTVGPCPKANPPLGQRYNMNNQYQPRLVSFLWHPYPYSQMPSNSWVEVYRQADPFGDEHFGAWFMYTPGSGIYFNLGKTISFAEHQDAYAYFSITKGNYNEETCKAAAGQGFDSIQFLAHVDHVNYQCDTKNTGTAGLQYMGVEVVAVKLVGTTACGTPTGAPDVVKVGWQASRKCTCDNKQSFLNCEGVPSVNAVIPGDNTQEPIFA